MTALTTGSGTINPTWDLNGNLSNDGTSAYTWDVRNRLLSVGSLASFAYDAAGRRLSLTPGGGSAQYYLYDRLNPAAVLTASGGVLGQFLTGLNLDERFSAAASGITESYLVDALGSTIALVNAAGTTLPTTYSYAPFGTTHTAGTASANPFQFTGRENDPTSLYYLRARYYNPVWGRFISEDPIGLSGGINLYAYGGNDPLNLADPGGLLGLVVSIGAQGEAGSLLFGQAGGQVSQNIAFLIDTSRWSWSHPLNIGFSVVSYQSYGGTASLGLPSVPQGPASNPLSGIANSGGGVIAGGFTGGGVSLGITNADTAADLAPPSATSSVNIGLLGTEFGGQISKTATGIWTATAAIPGLSVGAGVAASVYQTQSGVQTLSTASPK